MKTTEYISRDEVLSYIYATHSTGGFKTEEDYLWLQAAVVDAATSDVQPVRHGEWVYNDKPIFGNPYGRYCCSMCGSAMDSGNDNYCPCCGARMDGDTE